MTHLIGRQIETQVLKEALSSSQAELIAMYGRRRVGKTFLIRTIYKKDILFECTGLNNATLPVQLDNFTLTLAAAFNLPIDLPTPINWLRAFRLLIQVLEEKMQKKRKKVIFLDEFLWLDTPKSGFLSAFDHFWNNWASKQDNLVVVICGSAASWMIQNIVSNKGGLHNHITRRIRLLPFNLYETETFLRKNRVTLDHYQLLQLYMVTGGIPHYLKDIRAGESTTQAIDRLCFTNDGVLRNEFQNLYIALFEAADRHIAIVKALANKPTGMSRNEILAVCDLTSGGGITKLLEELSESGFITQYMPVKR